MCKWVCEYKLYKIQNTKVGLICSNTSLIDTTSTVTANEKVQSFNGRSVVMVQGCKSQNRERESQLEENQGT